MCGLRDLLHELRRQLGDRLLNRRGVVRRGRSERRRALLPAGIARHHRALSDVRGRRRLDRRRRRVDGLRSMARVHGLRRELAASDRGLRVVACAPSPIAGRSCFGATGVSGAAIAAMRGAGLVGHGDRARVVARVDGRGLR